MFKQIAVTAAVLGGLMSAGVAAAQERYGALAVDRNNGFYYGFAYDQPTRADAEQRAIAEGRKRGGNVSVVLVWSGDGCGAYRTVQSGQGDAYGWGVARTRPEADAIASREAAKRAPGVPTPNNVWGCNTAGATPLNILKNEPVGDANAGAGIVLQNQRIVNGAGFSPDGKLVATLSYGDGKVMVWDVRSGALVRTLEGLNSSPSSLAVSGDGRVAATDSQTLMVWDMRSGAKLGEIKHKALLRDLAFSPDGSRLYAVGAQEEYDVPTGGWMFWTLDGTSAALIRKTTLVEPHTHAYYAADYSPDGRFVVTGGNRPGQSLNIWDSGGGRALVTRAPYETVREVTYSPDGRHIAISDETGVDLVDAGSGRTVAHYGGGVVYEVAFSKDGRKLAAAQRDGSVTVWDVASGQQLAKLTGHTKLVETVAFSPDGRLLVSGSEDGTARLWDVDAAGPLAAQKASGKGRPTNASSAPSRPAKAETPARPSGQDRAAAAQVEADRRAAEKMAAEAEERARTDALNREVAERDAAIKARNEAAKRESERREKEFRDAQEAFRQAKAKNDAEVAAAKAAREKYERDLKAYEDELKARAAGKP